jgi:hypothetical protein
MSCNTRALLILIGASVIATGVPVSSWAGTSTLHGGAINGVTVVRGTDQSEITSTTYVGIPGATASIAVPSGQTWLTIARFTAQTECFSYTYDSTQEPCLVHIVGSNGSTNFEFKPGGGANSIISGVVGAGVGNVASNTIAGSAILAGPATYQVKVLGAVAPNHYTHLLLSHWQLEVMTAPQK